MQTNLSEFIRSHPEGREADAILRSCVHCGFCTATCPTYQLLGDELDGPRGRIYLMKQMFEGGEVTHKTQLHLDRCLTCRSCETTCPSGVKYGRLVDIGRAVVERRVQRPPRQRLQRWLLRKLILNRSIFGASVAVGRALRPLLPESLKAKIPKDVPRPRVSRGAKIRHARRMLILDSCVQPVLSPAIDLAAARVLDRIGISLVRVSGAGCCGAVSHHLSANAEALEIARRNIDAWSEHLDNGVEALVITASGCGVMVKEYGHLLRDDPAYASIAARISLWSRDIHEIIAAEWQRIECLIPPQPRVSIAFHSPCTLQHGLQVHGQVEKILRALGHTLTRVPNGHLCCGSAGTYSILQPELAGRLKENKLAALVSGGPDMIASANIGCITHLQTGAAIPVMHWIELLDQALAPVTT